MNTCRICDKKLIKNNDNQIIYYCSDSCRKLRHNRFKGMANKIQKLVEE